MTDRNILIIGGNGFIGRNLSQYFVNKQEHVYSFDLRYPQRESDQVVYLCGDFFDDETLKTIVEKMDVVIHAVSTINPGNSGEYYMRGYEKDFIQSVKLAELSIKNKFRLIFLSSGGTVYGIQENQPITEQQNPVPINHYGCLKLCIENVMRTMNRQSNGNILIARVANPYGPGQDYHKGVGFIDAAIKKSLHDEVIEIWGDGTTIRDYIHIEDVCDMIYCLSKYEGCEEVFNISSGVGVSQNYLISLLEEYGLKPSVIFKDARSVDIKKVVLNNERILSVCKSFVRPIEIGLKQYIEEIKKEDCEK
ncbi:NAD-dependent epimerase/dehydratase family protein [Clostridiaceae bacterium DONG20-135]|uniref:NAD-dependent epimerase/dehydratase family protein n=1 Tax=Copranaerobaculum intestinale TaxID=2692629 RepID=A0A6N8U8V0_9FIRM|nr:NAD-dependent epimerase/dehydratase family protein [Copranaerobaculum intestinale]MXQ72989.1 NAD-dependent epimerase/dehydratase family protein [Copranaerobaculum intestinale]